MNNSLGISEKTSLKKAREILMNNVEKGVECPCCHRHVELYRYKFHRNLAEAVLKIVRVYERTEKWVHVAYVDPTRHLSKAAHWGLIEPKINEATGRRVVGLWRPTKKGNDFVYKFRKIPSHVFLLNNEVQGFSNKKISIIDAMEGEKNYNTLMLAM